MKAENNKKILDELFTRGVGEFIDPDGAFRKKLETNPEKVVIKFGVDPTRPDIHLGHAVVLRKLRQFQDLGAKVIFLIGDYTGQIGDPTGKSKVRPEIEMKELEKNMKTYLEQVGGLLKSDPAVFSWIRNSDWFTAVTDIQATPGLQVNLNNKNGVVGVFEGNSFVGKALLFSKTRMQETHLHSKEVIAISLSGVLATLRHITHSRLIARDMFQDRITKGTELYMHEMLYPVLQGIDSHVLARLYGSCDLEVGGTDQTFNMLVGRDVMKMNRQSEQAVLSFKLLEGLDGKEKMSKSLDNYVGITDEPNDMYGKIMSVPDASIGNYFELCTFTPMDEVAEIRKSVTGGKINPKDLKMSLAKQIVAIYHGDKKAAEAENNWVATFSNKEIPDEMEEVTAEKGETLVDVLVAKSILPSKSEWRRLVEQNAIHDLESDSTITDLNLKLEKNLKLKIGKKRFIQIVIK